MAQDLEDNDCKAGQAISLDKGLTILFFLHVGTPHTAQQDSPLLNFYSAGASVHTEGAMDLQENTSNQCHHLFGQPEKQT